MILDWIVHGAEYGRVMLQQFILKSWHTSVCAVINKSNLQREETLSLASYNKESNPKMSSNSTGNSCDMRNAPAL